MDKLKKLTRQSLSFHVGHVQQHVSCCVKMMEIEAVGEAEETMDKLEETSFLWNFDIARSNKKCVDSAGWGVVVDQHFPTEGRSRDSSDEWGRCWFGERSVIEQWKNLGCFGLGMKCFPVIWVFPKIRVPQNGWFTMEIPIKMDDLGVPPFSETPGYVGIKTMRIMKKPAFHGK